MSIDIEKYRVNHDDFKKKESIKMCGGFNNVSTVIQLSTHESYIEKEFNKTLSNEKAKLNFKDEIENLIRFHHPAIVQFFGFSEKNQRGFIYLPNMKNGSLRSYISKIKIKSNLNHNFTNTNKFIISYGIAKAMEYLHSQNHTNHDLKSSNVLLDENLRPFLTDFCKRRENISPGSIIMPPEIIDGSASNLDLFQSDVYSYGMVLYELWTGIIPFSHLKNHFHIMKAIDNGEYPEIPDFVPKNWKDFIQICLSKDYEKRPTFKNIVDELKTDKYLTNDMNKESIQRYIEFVSNELICPSCLEIIENNDFLSHSDFNYHKGCLKCLVCQKNIESNDKFDNFVCLKPGCFVCKAEYKEFYDKLIKNSINRIFNPIILNDKIDLQNENEFLEPGMIENSYQLNKNLKYFIPTVTFHFSFSPIEINFKELFEILPEEMIIVNIERGSTFLTIAFILSDEVQNNNQKYKEIIEKFKSNLDKFTALNKPIVGNFKGEPILKIPDEKDIKEFYSKKSVNFFQNNKILEKIDLNEIKKEIIKNINLQKDKCKNEDWKYIIDHFDLFTACENQVCQNIKENENEFIIVGETIIPNRFYEKYEKIRKEILNKHQNNEESINESFVYHGTPLFNQPGIIGNHFLHPSEDKVKRRDNGYFGVGIYATDNIFYASLYSNEYHLLNYNEKATVICCQSIYNNNSIVQIDEDNFVDFEGFDPSKETINNYGVHIAFVESSKDFRMNSIQNNEESLINAIEYVFPNKYQIIPVCSLTLMRTEFFILWIDEVKKYSKICEELKTIVEENVYYSNSDEESRQIVELKKRNRMKIILSFNDFSLVKDMINSIREIIGSNFICFVFSDDLKHKQIVNDLENVLYSNDVEDLKRFVKIDLRLESIIPFCNHINDKFGLKLNIKKRTILEFNIDKFEIPLKLLSEPEKSLKSKKLKILKKKNKY